MGFSPSALEVGERRSKNRPKVANIYYLPLARAGLQIPSTTGRAQAEEAGPVENLH